MARKDTLTNSVIFILRGQLKSFDSNYTPTIHNIGSIIGLEEFLFTKNWSVNIYGADAGYFLKLE